MFRPVTCVFAGAVALLTSAPHAQSQITTTTTAAERALVDALVDDMIGWALANSPHTTPEPAPTAVMDDALERALADTSHAPSQILTTLAAIERALANSADNSPERALAGTARARLTQVVPSLDECLEALESGRLMITDIEVSNLNYQIYHAERFYVVSISVETDDLLCFAQEIVRD